jgi:hypothetical protein
MFYEVIRVLLLNYKLIYILNLVAQVVGQLLFVYSVKREDMVSIVIPILIRLAF